MSGLMFPKVSRPRALDRRDRKRAEDAEYKRNSATARERDGHRCRICGRHFGLSSHHVVPRSLARRSPSKHAVERLLTVCWGPQSCHEQIDQKVLKVYPTTDQGTNGPCLVEKWDDDVKDYVVAIPAA